VRILILAVGRLKDGPERELVARYGERAAATGRLLGFTGFDCVELPESRAQRPADRKAEEAAALMTKAGDAALVVFDEKGSSPTSEAFAGLLASRRDAGRRTMAMVVGGPDGLDPALAAGADARIAFGQMTLPHQIVRGLVAEQLYRAMTILAGHPYHRA
jgi:23S rRNA (pseudouridine1915-N3)-methyltransferase